MLRYRNSRCGILIGTTNGNSQVSLYAFFEQILEYDLAGFFQRNSAEIREEIHNVLEILLRKDNHVSSLAWVSFCRLVIETSSAAFNHVSMSFQDEVTSFDIKQIESLYIDILEAVIRSASVPLPGFASVYSVDAREPASIDNIQYSHIVTSPPYPNRISYIRELRPYMYWTQFLDTAREAGELDWKAIGGTWGSLPVGCKIGSQVGLHFQSHCEWSFLKYCIQMRRMLC